MNSHCGMMNGNESQNVTIGEYEQQQCNLKPNPYKGSN